MTNDNTPPNELKATAAVLRAWAETQPEDTANLALILAEQIEIAAENPQSKALRQIIQQNLERLRAAAK